MPFTWIRPADHPVHTASDNAPTGIGMPDEQRKKLGALLSNTGFYLRENALAHPGLETAINEMHSAVAAYQSNQAQDLYGPIRRVFQAIEAQRRLDPSIPQP